VLQPRRRTKRQGPGKRLTKGCSSSPALPTSKLWRTNIHPQDPQKYLAEAQSPLERQELVDQELLFWKIKKFLDCGDVWVKIKAPYPKKQSLYWPE
jgi:hypothetical protein